jgi:O-antigen/teichoic acid export membrane protein
MLALFINGANLFIDSGFSQALIQRQNTTRVDESTIFFFNLIMGALVALALCAAAPWIAAFYKQPILREILYLMALNLFISSLGAIHTTLLTKELKFKIIMKSSLIAILSSGVLAVFIAMRGSGVWSLVWQTLSFTIVSVITLWILHPWRPQWVFSFTSLRSFFRFGGFLLLTNLLTTLYTNLYSLLIGKMYLTRDVGFYTRAQRLQQLPATVMTSIVGRVAFPVFSSVAEDKARLARGMRKATAGVMLINIPIMVVLVVLAKPVVLTLLGQKWLPSAPVLQVLSLGGFLWPIHALNLNVLKAQGHTDLNVRLVLIKLVIGVSLLALASPYGIVAIAWAQVASSMLAFFVNAYYAGVFLDYGAWPQLRDLFPYFASSIPMALTSWMTMRILNLPVQIELIISILLGGLTYLVVCKLIRLDAFEEMVAMVLRKKRPEGGNA